MSLRRATRKRTHTYELYAMIVHQGNFSAKGHYFAMVRHKTIPNAWLKFDDENVTLIKDSEKFNAIVSQAYILFYQRKWIFQSDEHILLQQ